MKVYPRGSEWRRWDLHMHTPETIKNDQFEGSSIDEKWDKFYSDISTYIGDGTDPLKNISVIGITDYLSIKNYKKVVLDNRLPNSVEMIIPNDLYITFCLLFMLITTNHNLYHNTIDQTIS